MTTELGYLGKHMSMAGKSRAIVKIRYGAYLRMSFNDGLPPRLMWLLGIRPEEVIGYGNGLLWLERRLGTRLRQRRKVKGSNGSGNCGHFPMIQDVQSRNEIQIGYMADN